MNAAALPGSVEAILEASDRLSPYRRFSREEFVLGTQGLRARIMELVKRTNGTIYPLGTWHNHLVASGPSPKDMRSALLLAPAQTTPLLMLIHTPGGYRRLVMEVVPTPQLPVGEGTGS